MDAKRIHFLDMNFTTCSQPEMLPKLILHLDFSKLLKRDNYS